MIIYIATIVVLLLLAPILLSFIKSLKMMLLFKRPASLLQGYKNFSKLMSKETIISQETSSITKYAPFLVLSPLLVTMFFLPPVVHGAYYVSFVDALPLQGLSPSPLFS